MRRIFLVAVRAEHIRLEEGAVAHRYVDILIEDDGKGGIGDDFLFVHLQAFLTVQQNPKSVMPGHSRSKNGVASLAYVPGIHVSTVPKTWIAGTSPAMTAVETYSASIFTWLVILRQVSICPASQVLASASEEFGTMLNVCF